MLTLKRTGRKIPQRQEDRVGPGWARHSPQAYTGAAEMGGSARTRTPRGGPHSSGGRRGGGGVSGSRHRSGSRRGPCLQGCGPGRGRGRGCGPGAAAAAAGSERAGRPYLVVNVELDILRQGADVAPRADVVVHDSGDGGVVERLGDPLELHGRHLPSLLLRLLPQAPASLRSEPVCGPGGFRGAATTRARASRTRPPGLRVRTGTRGRWRRPRDDREDRGERRARPTPEPHIPERKASPVPSRRPALQGRGCVAAS